jgi:hypothetical protein
MPKYTVSEIVDMNLNELKDITIYDEIIKQEALFYFIIKNEFEKIKLLDNNTNYYIAFMSLKYYNAPFSIKNDLIKFLQNKIHSINTKYVIRDMELCENWLSKIYHYK